MKLLSCHPSGAYNFVAAPTFLENLNTPELNTHAHMYINQQYQTHGPSVHFIRLSHESCSW